MIICSSILIVSCNDFLDEDARGVLSPENFFQNEQEAMLALNRLNKDFTEIGFTNFLGTDLGVVGRNRIAGLHHLGVYQYDVTHFRVTQEWENNYSSIRNANLLLSRIGDAPLSEEVIGSTTAQALFFRAEKYLRLSVQIGDVPSVRDEVSASNIESLSLLGSSTVEDNLADAINDLDQAIESGYLSESSWADNNGLPTVWAARMLKAYCHIWLDQWVDARDELREIVNNSPHVLHDDYADKYRGGNELHSEIIYGKQRLANVAGSGIAAFAHPNFAGEVSGRRFMDSLNIQYSVAAYTLRKSFADTYDDNDARKIYNVMESGPVNDETIEFDWIYLPKLMRAPVPFSDPLLAESESNFQSSAPIRIFLLADAYLLLAEAEFMAEGAVSTMAALDPINEIRDRANLPALSVLTIEDIQAERAWELVGEGYWGRKKDLLRWGILEDTVLGLPAAEIAAGVDQSSLAFTRAQDVADVFANSPVSGRFEFLPIPFEVLQVSVDVGGDLTQNDAWIDTIE